MKKITASLLFAILISCSPKLRSNIDKVLAPLSDKALVVVLDAADDQIINGTKIGDLKAVDGGFAENCTYYENVQNLKSMARQNGANLVRITKQISPDKRSACFRLWANIYKVDDPKRYETEIVWSVNRKLTWDDFKGQPDQITYPNALALTNSGFGYESSANLFKDGKLFIQCVFKTYESWVLPNSSTDYILRHEQIHFDITEIYSRKLRKALTDLKITAVNADKAKPVFDKIFKEFNKRQDRYDSETKRGAKKETQEFWEATVKIELAKYALYKENE
ncbi:DUF922 domain-containing protein [Winogradskyella sp. UBA3174]|uniref:DUF922 domain-containing protein n=1 Tax=Winogradskyella sp. UBA3174 TaxID=1947785 RepID=UPI0025D3568D|nr:DUF922 domain-containing protein [Winogradskyella sp. UBA3174]|tara:strand:+ start:6224 stop:7060 length:837 start_codon:yes stop_codon:yes gene_type:complete